MNSRLMREHFPGPIVTSGSYTRESGEEALESGLADLVAFGRPVIPNPDLVSKLQNKQALAAADREWLNRLVSRRVAPGRIHDAFDRGPDDIKVVVEFSAS